MSEQEPKRNSRKDPRAPMEVDAPRANEGETSTAAPPVVPIAAPSSILAIQMAMFTEGVDISAIVDDSITQFEFIGFDPIVLNKKLLSLARTSRQLVVDMTKLVTICLTRGTVVEKIRRALKPESLTEFNALIQKYDIQPTGGKLRRPSHVPTLARISATYPTLAIYVTSSERFISLESVPNYPKFLHFPAAGALISQFNAPLREGYLRWCGLFSQRINATANYELNNTLLSIGDPTEREKLYNWTVFHIAGAGVEADYSNGERIGKASFATPQEAMSIVTVNPGKPPHIDVEDLDLPKAKRVRR